MFLAGLVGLLAHELAHTIVQQPNHEDNEQAADMLVSRWGFDMELKALRAACPKEGQAFI